MEESTKGSYGIHGKYLMKAIKDSSDQVQEEIMENLEGPGKELVREIRQEAGA